jgi:hypothetical protein
MDIYFQPREPSSCHHSSQVENYGVGGLASRAIENESLPAGRKSDPVVEVSIVLSSVAYQPHQGTCSSAIFWIHHWK